MNENSDKQNKLIRSKTWFFTVATILICCALLIVLGQAINILATPLAVVLWTIIIVFCLRGIVSGLERRGIGRGFGTAIAYLIMIAVIALILFLMLSPTVGLSDQFASLVQSAPEYVRRITEAVMGLYAQYADFLNDDSVKKVLDQASSAVMSGAQTLASSSVEKAISFGSGLANTVMAIGFALVIAFWILMSLPALGRECNRLISGSKHEEDWRVLHVTVTRIMGGYIKATLLQCAIIAVGCGILFAIAGIPNFAAIALITGVMNIIPVIGPWIGGALAALVGLFVNPVIAVVALVGTIAIQQFVYTFISPALMQGSVDIHPALTLLGLLVGSALGGAASGLVGSVVGMLLAVPAVAVIKSLFVYYFEKSTGRQLVAEDGVFFQGSPSEKEGVDPLGDVVSLNKSNSPEFFRRKRQAHRDKLNQAIQGNLDKDGELDKLESTIEQEKHELQDVLENHDEEAKPDEDINKDSK